jgi:hypothetical protein
MLRNKLLLSLEVALSMGSAFADGGDVGSGWNKKPDVPYCEEVL